MIYFKRFLFGILAFCSITFGVIGIISIVITFPIWGFTYFIITGKNPLNIDFDVLYWDEILKFVEWCELKLIKNDKR